MTLVESLLVILGIISLGILCAKRKVFDNLQIEGFAMLLFKVIMPCYLFMFTLQNDLSSLIAVEFTYSYILTLLTIAFFISCYYFKRDSLSEICIKVLTTSYINSAIYSLPIIILTLGDGKSAVLVTLLQIIIIQPFFVIILSLINHKEKSLGIRVLTSLSNPLIFMPILGLICNNMQYDPPVVLITIIKNLSAGTSGLALFIFGLNLSDLKINKNTVDKDLVLMIFTKNILNPIIAYLIGFYIFQLEKYWLYSLVIIASSPSAFIIYLIAREYKLDHNLIKKCVAISSIVSLITLIFIIWLI